MGLRNRFTDLMAFPSSATVGICGLFMPPDPIPVGRRADNIIAAVKVYVLHVHVRTVFSQVSGMEIPIWLCPICRRFPPTRLDDNILAAILIDISQAETMRKNICTGSIDVTHRKPLPHGRCFCWRTQPHDLLCFRISTQNIFPPIAIYINKTGRFISYPNCFENRMFLPILVPVLRILIPKSTSTWKPDD